MQLEGASLMSICVISYGILTLIISSFNDDLSCMAASIGTAESSFI